MNIDDLGGWFAIDKSMSPESKKGNIIIRVDPLAL